MQTCELTVGSRVSGALEFLNPVRLRRNQLKTIELPRFPRPNQQILLGSKLPEHSRRSVGPECLHRCHRFSMRTRSGRFTKSNAPARDSSGNSAVTPLHLEPNRGLRHRGAQTADFRRISQRRAVRFPHGGGVAIDLADVGFPLAFRGGLRQRPSAPKSQQWPDSNLYSSQNQADHVHSNSNGRRSRQCSTRFSRTIW